MKEKLPNVYVNNAAKGVSNNNKKIFYSHMKNNDEVVENNSIKELLVRKKINDIFLSNKFVYKVKALVTTKSEGTNKETLISKSNDELLTLSNKKIKYEDIIDIKII